MWKEGDSLLSRHKDKCRCWCKEGYSPGRGGCSGWELRVVLGGPRTRLQDWLGRVPWSFGLGIPKKQNAPWNRAKQGHYGLSDRSWCVRSEPSRSTLKVETAHDKRRIQIKRAPKRWAEFPRVSAAVGRRRSPWSAVGTFPGALSLSLGGGARPGRSCRRAGRPEEPAQLRRPAARPAEGELTAAQHFRDPVPHGHLHRRQVGAPSPQSPALIAAAEHQVRISAERGPQRAELPEGLWGGARCRAHRGPRGYCQGLWHCQNSICLCHWPCPSFCASFIARVHCSSLSAHHWRPLCGQDGKLPDGDNPWVEYREQVNISLSHPAPTPLLLFLPHSVGKTVSHQDKRCVRACPYDWMTEVPKQN